jgi:hypothetical protein
MAQLFCSENNFYREKNTIRYAFITVHGMYEASINGKN